MKKFFLTGVVAALGAISLWAHPIDFSRIQHWTGTGPNQAALVIQFNGDTYGTDAMVWGYRWENGENPNGETMFKAICANSSRLSLLTQYTGSMGSTVCGIGYGLNQEALRHVRFNFDKAKTFEFINFDYYNVNSFMGQTAAPGDDSPVLAQQAIDAAIAGPHYIQHPFDYGTYGYPAYDYDCWPLDEELSAKVGPSLYEPKWLSAWYEGYWSYWCANSQEQDWMYSGAGFTGRQLTNGAVDGWSFTQFETAMVGGMGEGVAPCEDGAIHYIPARLTSAQIDASKAVRPIGEGNKWMPVIVRFGDKAKVDNVVLRLQFSEALPDVNAILSLLNNDKAFNLDGNTLSLDANDDGAFDADGADVSTTGQWKVKEYEDALLLSVDDSEPDYLLYLPVAGVATAVVPEEITRHLSDNDDYVPVFVQRSPDNVSVNYTWYRRADDANTHSNTSSDIIKSVSTSAASLGKLSYTGNNAGTVYLHARVRTGSGSSYSYSNICKFTLLPPERPIESISFEQETIDAPLNSTIENAMTIVPEDATYTGLTFKSSNTKVATANAKAFKTTKAAGEATITVSSTWNPDVKGTFSIISSLKNPVEDLAIQGVEGDVIVLNPKRMIGIICDITPANADIPDFNVKLEGAGTGKQDAIASMYKVNYWDENNTRIQFYELSGHRVGECKLTLTTTDGSNVSKTYTVRVQEQDRTPLENGYLDGTLIINEEWFGHTNGGMNYITPEGKMMYQVYERENPGMSFGCTSQYAAIWADRLIAISKQATDGGDPLPGGGRVVVADAKTLKYQGHIDNLIFGDETRSADGRGVVGATPDKVYVGSSNGIYIVDINEVKVVGKITDFDESGSAGADLYNGQIGDMVHAGRYVFGIKQAMGAFAIDVATDRVVKQYPMSSVQGITQSADGNIWVTATVNGQAHFTCINPSTLEIDREQSVVMPASVGAPVCAWGAWRNTPFVGCQSRNTLWFNTGGGIAGGSSSDRFYGWEIGSDPTDLQPIFALDKPAKLPGSNSRVFQKTYGTLRYDDRSGELIVMTTEDQASGHYRYNWTHFIDPASGKILRTIALEPYYWFQAFAIFPDKYNAVFSLNDITIDMNDSPMTIDLREVVTDADNIDANILFSLVETPQTYSEVPATVSLEGSKLTVTPQSSGTHYFTLAAQSNGREVTQTIGVNVTDKSGVDDIAANTGSMHCDGQRLYIDGFNGKRFSIFDLAGVLVNSFDVDSDSYIYDFGSHAGVFVVSDNQGVSTKVIIKR